MSDDQATGDGSRDAGRREPWRGDRGVSPNYARTKAKLTEEQREKVREVRLKGACLRCRLSKVKCSTEDPCGPCLSSAMKSHERKVLSFCYCVRTQLADVNIFQHQPYNRVTLQPSLNAIDQMLSQSQLPIPGVEEATEHVVSWILNEGRESTSRSSMVGMVISQALFDTFQDSLDPRILADLRRFVLAASLAYSGWVDPGSPDGSTRLTWKDLQFVTYISGSDLLGRLERLLSPQAISASKKKTQQTLFLVVFGTILGVGYSTLTTTSPYFPRELLSPGIRESPTLWVLMKEHLCAMLAHYLIFLGSTLGHKLTTDKEKFIVESAIDRWNRSETFLWAHEVLPPPSQTLPRGLSHQPAPDGTSTAPMTLSSPTMVPCTDALQSALPGSVSCFEINAETNTPAKEGSPEQAPARPRKHRTILMVGPCNDQQVYSKTRTTEGMGRGRLLV